MISRIKILAISNDSSMLGLLQRELDKSFYEVVGTEETDVTLRDVLETEQPDFIILDIMMPNLDGIETCLRLRQWTQTPILMLSTWGTGDGMVRGLNLGSASYLTEPFGIEELKSRINDTIRRAVSMKEIRA